MYSCNYPFRWVEWSLIKKVRNRQFFISFSIENNDFINEDFNLDDDATGDNQGAAKDEGGDGWDDDGDWGSLEVLNIINIRYTRFLSLVILLLCMFFC